MREILKADPEACEGLFALCERIGFSRHRLLDGDPDLELLYVTLEAISTGLWYTDLADYRRAVGEEFFFTTPADWLRDLMVQVLVPPALEAQQSPCELHCRLFDGLEPGDSVISFNYDLIADAALARSGRWFELGGYGFLAFDLLRENYFDRDDLERPCAHLLLKPHGSLNWRLEPSLHLPRDDHVSLGWMQPGPVREELLGVKGDKSTDKLEVTLLSDLPDDAAWYAERSTLEWARYYGQLLRDHPENAEGMLANHGIYKASGAPLIVPPGYYKFRDEKLPGDLAFVWSCIWRALKGADRLICVGYSFPTTDAEFLALFRLALAARRQPTSVAVVNPDATIAERVRWLAPTAEVHHVAETLEEFCTKLI